MRECRVRLVFFSCTSVVLLAAGVPSWRSTPATRWTEQDARQVLDQSPWSMTVNAGIARRESEDELREGGRMGQPKGVGYDGVDPKGSGLPRPTASIFTGSDIHSARSLVQAITLRLRWESALPVQIAELKAHEIEPPTLEGEGYRIAVYGVPGPAFKGDPIKLGNPLKENAVLKREGKKDVKPSSVEVFERNDGLAVVYLFPPSAEISRKDARLEFQAHIGRIVVAQVFNLAEMEFQGKLEL